jgi:beta-lactamase class A
VVAAPPAAPPPALVAPAPYEVSFGRFAGIAAPGAHAVVVRVGGRVLARRTIRGRSFDFVVALPRRDATVVVSAGRTFVVPHVLGLPRSAAPHAARGQLEPSLARRLTPLARSFRGTSAYFVEELGTGRGAAWNARARFPAASTLKLAIAVEALRTLPTTPRPGSYPETLLRRMLIESDNDAANELESFLGGSTTGGGARVDALVRSLGLNDTEMYGGYERSTQGRPIPVEASSAPSFGRGKYTSAHDLARLLTLVHLAAGGIGPLAERYRGEFTPADARHLLYLLAQVGDRGKLGLLLQGRPVALLHKAGWISDARHDAGLVYYPGGVFVAVVMTWSPAGVGAASDGLAGRVAAAALALFNS